MTQSEVAGGVHLAYEHCEIITRTQARNFSYGIRLLPPPKRRALSAVYALARRIDDIGDGDLPPERKLDQLAAARRAIRGFLAGPGHTDDAVLVALTDAARRYPIPLDAFDELIEGCEADVRGTAYATFDDLLHYCRCVAGSIGRLSLGVFGADDIAGAAARADALGIALQLTNILRDVREDHLNDRSYLPAEDLERFGARLEMNDSGEFTDVPGLTAVMRFEAERAREWYERGLRLLPMLDRRSAACAAAMAGIYRRLLDRIAANPAAALRGRMSLSGGEKVAVALRSLAGGRP